ncbi:MAG TPA: flagellar hook-associated protein FlgK [Patescibacteria group bacterium]|nr:flagellar hook-associated protein FlgK [Patescibacteria group bacterium]
MPGLFDTLSLATRAMQAQQAGVTISGQNLANVNNPAYSRQRVNFQTSDAVPLPNGILGTGVQVAGIEQIRDGLLDVQIRDETSVGGFWTTAQSALQNTQTELGQFLNDTSSTDGTSGASGVAGAQGLSTQLSNLFSAFQAVATDPTSVSKRQVLVNQAQTLASSFNQVAARLSSVNDSLNTSISTDTDSANKLLSDIADLNDQITRTEIASGSTANDLRDLREQKLESLAHLTNFQTGTAADGSLTLAIGGVTMISGAKLNDTLQAYDAGAGQLQIRAATAGTTLTLSGGSITGAIDTRDGALASLRSGLDSLASQLAIQVNSAYSAGYDLNGNTGAAFFTGTNAATLGVNSSLADDPSKIQAAGVPGAIGDGAVALSVARLAQQTNAALNNQTFGDAYGGIVTDLGNALSNANDQVASQEAVNTMLAKQRDSISGVSMEEELTNLMTFQKAYQASAQIISTVNSMLTSLINMKST